MAVNIVNSTDIVWPDWTNSVDNWRDTDAEWLRNRSLQIFPDAATRASVLGTVPQYGVLSILQTPAVNTPGGTEFWNGTAWESVRYPNLQVTSDGTSVTLRRYTAGTGIQLMNDGSVNIAKAFIGTGGIGATIDNTGITLKIGADTAKIATDANGFTFDSPIALGANALYAGPITASQLTVSGLSTLGGGFSASGANTITGSLTASGTVQGGTLQAGTVQITGNQVKPTTGAAGVTLATDTLTLAGVTVNVGGASTAVVVPGTLNPQKLTTFNVVPVVSASGKDPNIQEAMIMMQSGGAAPSAQNPPDGTLFIIY